MNLLQKRGSRFFAVEDVVFWRENHLNHKSVWNLRVQKQISRDFYLIYLLLMMIMMRISAKYVSEGVQIGDSPEKW